VHVPVRREPPDEPPGEFRRLRDRLLSDLERWPELVAESLRETVPRAEVERTDQAYLVDVDLPGVPPPDVGVEVGHGRLVVTGRRRTRGGRADGRSGGAGRVRLALTLPDDVDADAVTAELEHGVLQLHLPRRAPRSGRRIPVRVRGSVPGQPAEPG
jgi:HSP20 family protein